MNVISHYTTFDACLLILLEGKIKFGNIKNCNDKIEIELVKGKSKNYLIFCGCTKPMSSLMWFAYAKNRYGACLSFILKKGKRKNKLLKFGNIEKKTGNITYVTKLPDKVNEAKVGLIKDVVFKNESEYRYLVLTTEEEFFAEINWDIVEKIKLQLSSFFNKKLIENLLKSYINVPFEIEINKQFNL